MTQFADQMWRRGRARLQKRRKPPERVADAASHQPHAHLDGVRISPGGHRPFQDGVIAALTLAANCCVLDPTVLGFLAAWLSCTNREYCLGLLVENVGRALLLPRDCPV